MKSCDRVVRKSAAFLKLKSAPTANYDKKTKLSFKAFVLCNSHQHETDSFRKHITNSLIPIKTLHITGDNHHYHLHHPFVFILHCFPNVSFGGYIETCFQQKRCSFYHFNNCVKGQRKTQSTNFNLRKSPTSIILS